MRDEIATPAVIAAIEELGWSAEPAGYNDYPAILCHPPTEDDDFEEDVWIYLDESGLNMDVSGSFSISLDEWLKLLKTVKGAVKV